MTSLHDTRWLQLDGTANTRDLGGLPTTDGGRTLPNRILRSDNLQTLTDEDVAALDGLDRGERGRTGPDPDVFDRV